MKIIKTLLVLVVLSHNILALELIKVKPIVVDGSVYRNGSWIQK